MEMEQLLQNQNDDNSLLRTVDYTGLDRESRRQQTIDRLLPRHLDYQHHAMILQHELHDVFVENRVTPFQPSEQDRTLYRYGRPYDEPTFFHPNFPYGRLQHAIFTLYHRDPFFRQNLDFILEADENQLDSLGLSRHHQTFIREAHRVPTYDVRRGFHLNRALVQSSI